MGWYIYVGELRGRWSCLISTGIARKCHPRIRTTSFSETAVDDGPPPARRRRFSTGRTSAFIEINEFDKTEQYWFRDGQTVLRIRVYTYMHIYSRIYIYYYWYLSKALGWHLYPMWSVLYLTHTRTHTYTYIWYEFISHSNNNMFSCKDYMVNMNVSPHGFRFVCWTLNGFRII